MKAAMIGVAAAALVLAGCTQAVQYGFEAGEAGKLYVDEVTDRREDLRMERYAVEDSLVTLYLNQAKRHELAGDMENARKNYEQALEILDSYYPDLNALRNRVKEFTDN